MKQAVGRPRIYETNADRVRAFRARKGVKRFSVELDTQTFDQFKKWLEFKDYSMSSIVAKLIKQQLLRKR